MPETPLRDLRGKKGKLTSVHVTARFAQNTRTDWVVIQRGLAIEIRPSAPRVVDLVLELKRLLFRALLAKPGIGALDLHATFFPILPLPPAGILNIQPPHT